MFGILGLFVLFGVASIAAGEYDLLAVPTTSLPLRRG